MDQKNLVVLTRVFLQENAWPFLPGGQKSGCNNEVTVLRTEVAVRGGGGFDCSTQGCIGKPWVVLT